MQAFVIPVQYLYKNGNVVLLKFHSAFYVCKHIVWRWIFVRIVLLEGTKLPSESIHFEMQAYQICMKMRTLQIMYV